MLSKSSNRTRHKNLGLFFMHVLHLKEESKMSDAIRLTYINRLNFVQTKVSIKLHSINKN